MNIGFFFVVVALIFHSQVSNFSSEKTFLPSFVILSIAHCSVVFIFLRLRVYEVMKFILN